MRSRNPVSEFAEHVLVKHADKITRTHLELAADICLMTADLRQDWGHSGKGLGNTAAAAVVDIPTLSEATGLPADIYEALGVQEYTEEDLVAATKEFVLAHDAFIVALSAIGLRVELPRSATGHVSPEVCFQGFLEAAQILRDLSNAMGKNDTN